MNEPLLQWVSNEQAREIVAKGGRWLDVRLPSEHQNLAIEGSLNIPLYFIRLKLSALDRDSPVRRVLRHRAAQLRRGLHAGRAGLRRLRADRGALDGQRAHASPLRQARPRRAEASGT